MTRAASALATLATLALTAPAFAEPSQEIKTLDLDLQIIETPFLSEDRATVGEVTRIELPENRRRVPLERPERAPNAAFVNNR